ncbi:MULTISPECIES: glycosyltransferase family 4 protein [unclassified Streptomyces]|uniref:glycosyltransferase family 4 protein n=1 Tax=unclassified Streptomyces TaxID=2593676 RepID=UPI002DDA89BE|nr:MULTISPECIES: glycosyltransferase family 4 protein [unclassified Streptomyces]WSC48828.1 glycosyltransferase family 4 protein [Streptomyces sp. NBC_01762]WSC52200.1 glycosyltransferase family 4 protein [Streptomyces sp. NBC_01761]WSF83047.1 glycosyltransferase family 4 protein [Streptomyces sp. NBC_01744]WSJ49514.1 glycosyltransferase family 4 protein [Streptomyces sp. NBC_01318]
MGELRAAPVNPAAATTMTGRSVIVVMPGGVDDPSAPSGGNTYDRRVCRDLPRIGWQVHEYAVAGTWPQPRATARAELTRILGESADGAVVVLDGLVACAVPEIIVPEAERLRLVVLVHLPLGDETGLTPGMAAALNAGERRTLQAAAAVVATSDWAAVRLVTQHGLDPGRVHVAAPGADTEPLATGTATGTDRAPSLLCVASVTPRKGQLQLVESLAAVADLPWNCVCVGGLGQNPGYVTRIRELIGRYSLGDRVHLVGPRTGADLNASYAAADLLVLASHAETYGMVATEALARGVPVLATAVGGLPDAVGRAPDRGVPGFLVPPQDPAAFASALRLWLGEPVERRRSKEAALVRRTALAGWDTTSRSLAAVLEQLRQESREAA